MKTLFLAAVVVVGSLGVMAASPAPAQAQHWSGSNTQLVGWHGGSRWGGGYGGWRGGSHWAGGYMPYSYYNGYNSGLYSYPSYGVYNPAYYGYTPMYNGFYNAYVPSVGYSSYYSPGLYRYRR